MNTKRQTVWLVSMLSLMVVLSAYYLFTEDVNDLDLTKQQAAGTEIKVDAITTGAPASTTNAAADKAASDKAAQDKAAADKAASAKDTADKSAAGKTATTDKTAQATQTPPSAATGKTGKTDEEVLKQVTASAKATSGNDYFASLHTKRNEDLSKEIEKWLAITVDNKKSDDEVKKAIAEVERLQDMDEKVMNVEDLLGKDFKNAIVLQDGGKWKVIVQTAKLEKSQGVSIVDMIMQEMNVTPDKVSVQYVQ
ncbi:SpoIIIAH-like family protein [Paenibacillus ginsengarvi]|uniref:SpoIIIAH-like family protein n=1 Tax=Paenibacillus ginsengarvi TaxID=400777 RepID=A0A3B0CIM3_9BACL|nr:SpoIIIAH-like family protein [Paenibacillus ginsengarvi]RKN84701.1 SpoIIIAH-like family protein [Paenibacillus ginsengarvi]